jgi:CubicO group peptidase (beta-lactamase class C family)
MSLVAFILTQLTLFFMPSSKFKHDLSACHGTKDIAESGSGIEMINSLDSLFKEEIAQQKMAGVVCLVSEKGKVVYSNALGHRNIEEGLAMEQHTMFRLQSMAKPIISLAILKLCAEGRINLDDPADKYFPQLKDKQVGVMKDGVMQFVPAVRPISIRHLLSHSSGLGSSWNAGELASIYEQHETSTNFESYEHWIESYMELPLINQPGNGLYYGNGHAVMEYLITKITGTSHKEYLDQEIFKPLNMDKTTFYLPKGEEKGLAQFYSLTETGQFKRTLPDSTYTGGDDIMSNVEDYHRFATLLLHNGYLEGKEFIKPTILKQLTTPAISLDGESLPFQKGYAFGLGVSIRLLEEKTDWKGSLGDYGWHGYFNTSFWIDREKQIIGIVLTQSDLNDNILQKKIKNIVYSKK